MLKRLALLVVISLVSAALFAQERRVIRGRVLDSDDNGIPGVAIEVIRNGRNITDKPVTSGTDGAYSASFNAGDPIEMVRYDHFDFFPGTVDEISGASNHDIHKTLYKLTERLEESKKQEIIAALERIAMADRKQGAGVVKEKLKQFGYERALRQLEKMELSMEERRRLTGVSVTYGVTAK